jgi:hypothetical protein
METTGRFWWANRGASGLDALKKHRLREKRGPEGVVAACGATADEWTRIDHGGGVECPDCAAALAKFR